MARIDYYVIENEIKTVLDADANLTGTKVYIEYNDPQIPEESPLIVIYLKDRTAVTEYVSAGQKGRYRIRFELWCYEFSFESIAKAAQARDDLIGKIEIALNGNRTLNGKVLFLQLKGGEFESGKTPGGKFFSGGSVVVETEAFWTT